MGILKACITVNKNTSSSREISICLSPTPKKAFFLTKYIFLYDLDMSYFSSSKDAKSFPFFRIVPSFKISKCLLNIPCS